MKRLFYISLSGIISILFFTIFSLHFQEKLNQFPQILYGSIGLGIGMASLILTEIIAFIHNKIKGE